MNENNELNQTAVEGIKIEIFSNSRLKICLFHSRFFSIQEDTKNYNRNQQFERELDGLSSVVIALFKVGSTKIIFIG